jgi:hypothetical protein
MICKVLGGVGTKTYLVMSGSLHGFVYDDARGQVAPASIKPGSAISHVGGFVRWRRVRSPSRLPAGLAAVLERRGITVDRR